MIAATMADPGPIVDASLLAFMGVVIVGALTAGGVIIGHIAKRLTEVEAEQRDLESYNDELWTWGRALIDLYYRWRRDDAPDPPKPPSRRDR